MRNSLRVIRREIKKEIAYNERTLKSLSRALRALDGSAPVHRQVRRRKHQLSAAGRKAISDAAKLRWAKAKRAQKAKAA
jgi:hypothetical protein